MPWLVRGHQDDDFEGVVRLLDATSPRQASVFSFAECIVALRARQAAVPAAGPTTDDDLRVIAGFRLG